MIISTISYKLACEALAYDFMKLRLDTEFPFDYEFGDYGEYFVGEDLGVFSDGSDYYHWNLSEMYMIVGYQIPYDIATEHQDWTIENEEKPDGWINLKCYHELRKGNDLPAKAFQRMLEREYHLDRASRLTDEYERVTEEQMAELKRKFENDLRESIK